jgi:hypothetical protein
MSSITFNCPINSVSFGQTSIAFLREAYKANLDCCIFPIGGQVDLSAQTPDENFAKWLHQTIQDSPKKHSRKNRTVKLWHVNGSLESYGQEQELITFLETDQVTDYELNIQKNQKIVWVTSKYTKSVMEEAGLNNVKYLQLGFDTHNFRKLNKRYYDDGITVIGVGGKFEAKRKAREQTIRALLENYGNNSKFMIHAAITNPFFKQEDNERIIHHLTQGKKYTNVVWLPLMPTNQQYNDFQNSVNIWCATSNAEGYDLPCYQALSLGKKVVALNAHVYPDYLNNDNAFLFDASGKQTCYDNIFFHQGQPFNQGNFFSWRTEDFINKLNEAISSPNKPQIEPRTYKQVFNELMSVSV